MSVTLEGIESLKDAIARLRAAPLEKADGHEPIHIYRDADIRVGHIVPDEYNPTSLYVLRQNLERLRDLRRHLRRMYGIDILDLNEVLHLRTDDGKDFGMAPPVVEVYRERVLIEPRGDDRQVPAQWLNVPIIKDGLHRTWIAREEDMPLKCVIIHGALIEHAPYAYPNAWSDVHVADKVPDVKKQYRRQDPYTFLRPLSALRQISGVQSVPEWGRK